MTKLIHANLTYTIRGVLFDVHNELGPNLPEKFYQEAVAIGLEEKGIQIQTEKEFEVLYQGVQVGRYYVDIWAEEGKVLLELKVAPGIEPIHEAQAISYLKVTDADLAMVVNFGEGSLQSKRLPNYVRDKQVPFHWQKKKLPPNFLYPDLMDELLKAMHHVHHELGPGFLHQVYRRATMVALRESGIGFEYLKQLPVYYRNHHLGYQPARLIHVENKLLLATMAVKQFNDTLNAQMKARLRQVGLPIGMLVNFYGTRLDFAMIRRDNNG